MKTLRDPDPPTGTRRSLNQPRVRFSASATWHSLHLPRVRLSAFLQTWVGGQAIHQLVNTMTGGALSGPVVTWLGISWAEFGCFMAFWTMQVWGLWPVGWGLWSVVCGLWAVVRGNNPAPLTALHPFQGQDTHVGGERK